MSAKSSDIIGSLSKGLRVLEAFNTDQSALSITEAAQATGLDRATARRCLLTLKHEGYAGFDGKYFTLTPRALRLGKTVLAALPLPRIVQPFLDQLAETTGETCAVSVLEHTEIVYVARAVQQRVLTIGLMPGARLPAYCTSMGRVLLAHLPPRDAREVIAASDLTPRTVHTVTSPHDLAAHLSTIRTAGYALVDQEVELGLRAVAVPLMDATGKVIAALNIGLAATHSDANEVVTEYLPHLKRVQAELAVHL